MITIPTQAVLPNWAMTTTLDGTTYRLEFLWNERAPAWFMTIATVDGTSLVSNLRVVVGFPFASRYRTLGGPRGALEAIDTSGKNIDPSRDDLGTRVQLVYTPEADL